MIQIQGFPKRSRRKIFKLPVEQKRNHFENYVDSPLCKERQLILCSKAGSQVKRGWGWEFDQTVECILASKGNIVRPPFLSQNSYWLGIAACLLSCKLELKIGTVPAAAVLCTCQQLLWQLQTCNEVMNGCANNRKMSVRHNQMDKAVKLGGIKKKRSENSLLVQDGLPADYFKSTQRWWLHSRTLITLSDKGCSKVAWVSSCLQTGPILVLVNFYFFFLSTLFYLQTVDVFLVVQHHRQSGESILRLTWEDYSKYY